MHCCDVGCFVHTYPLFRSVQRLLTMLFCATYWLYVHLHTLVYMFMHESCLLVCHPCFNIMRIWTSDPNLHLSFVDATFLFVFLLVYPLLVICYLTCLPLCSYVCSHPVCYACHCYLVCLFCTPLLLSMHLSLSIAHLLVSCLCLCMYTYGARTHRARARSRRRKQKGHGYKHANTSQAVVFNRFRV